MTRGLQDIAQLGNHAHAEELLKLGYTCYNKREYDQAIEYYTEAIRLDPKRAEALAATLIAGEDASVVGSELLSQSCRAARIP